MTGIMKVSTVLRNAQGMIDAPERWTKGAYARDADGHPIGFMRNEDGDPIAFWDDSDAVSLCGFAALCVVTSGMPDRAIVFLDRACPSDYVRWQDAPKRTHAEVMDVFDRAIALAEKEEGGR